MNKRKMKTPLKEKHFQKQTLKGQKPNILTGIE
jgi:hypothetical protein